MRVHAARRVCAVSKLAVYMGKPTGPDILEKWSHIAMRLFPPQMDVSCSPGWGDLAVHVRWKTGSDSDVLAARGVDLYFPQELMAHYAAADAEIQVKWDALIENAISAKLQAFDSRPGAGAQQRVERWLISVGRPGA